VEALATSATSPPVFLSALEDQVVGTCIRFDGRPIEEYCDWSGLMRAVPRLHMRFSEASIASWMEWAGQARRPRRPPAPDLRLLSPTTLELSITRKLPLSSNNSNAPLVSMYNVHAL
jgi:hypothetical protein